LWVLARDDGFVPLWRAFEHESLTSGAWDPARAEEAVRAIVADAEQAARDWRWPGHPLDDVGEDEALCSLYLGVAGMVWSLHRLGSAFDGAAALSAALAQYRRERRG
jgi:hypothetical protein